MPDPARPVEGMVGRPFTGRLVLGVIVLSLGVLFLLDNAGMMDAGAVLRWWPVVPLAYGLARLTGFCCHRQVVVGGLFTFLGAWLLLSELGMVHAELWDLWPLVLIALGISMVVRATSRGGVEPGGWGRDEGSSTISGFAMWSGLRRKVLSNEFRGGDLNAIMGGLEIDLRQAKPASGRAVLDVFVLWGGIDLFVPEDWQISIEAPVLMGAIEDTRKGTGTEPRGQLVLRGLVLMGGIEIKS